MTSRKTVNTFLATAIALTAIGAAGASAHAMGAGEGQEKCYGVVKAGHNDCGAADKSHECAGVAATDGAGGEWIGLPAGVCEKLVGGSLEPIAAVAEPEAATDTMENGKAH